jgi:MoxR-like ATPase
MPTPFLKLADNHVIDLGDRSGHHRPAHVIDRRSVVAINAALATGRPLLVRGEPGVGKSQLAHAAAVALGRRFRYCAVDASTEPHDLLYTIDAVARLARAQLVGALRTGTEADVAVEKFVRPGPLWWAFQWDAAAKQAGEPADGKGGEAVVVLIDEIDKADSSIPNALLDALGHRKFDVPGCPQVKMGHAPLVVITTNEERSLPDAFLRRCFVLHLSLPEGPEEVQQALRVRGAAHFPGCAAEILAHAATLIAERRSAMRTERLPAPGVAEYIDLVDAVLGQRADGVDPLALLEEIKELVLDKHAPPGSDRSA